MRLFQLLFLSLPFQVLCVVYQAENGVLLGYVAIKTDTSNFTGSGFVYNFTKAVDAVQFNVQGTAALYNISLIYRSVYDFKKSKIVFNGDPMGEFVLDKTSEWTKLTVAKLLMVEGANTITVYGGWGYWELDSIETQLTSPFIQPPASGLPVDSQATPEARNLLAFLQSQYGSKTISGQQDMSQAKWLLDNVGKYPAIVGFDFMDYSPSRVERGASSTSVEQAQQWAKMGGIVTFCWHWNPPSGIIDTPGKEWWRAFYTDSTTFNLAAALAEGPTGSNYTLLIRDIDAIAVQLKRLQTANISVLFRPLHEAEGGWFWWGAKGPEPCKQLYNILYDRIKNYHQIHNLIWVWNSINADWYVGSDKADIVSFDSYPDGADHSAQDSQFYKLVELGGRTKIVAMAENGPVPSPAALHTYGAVWSYFVTWGGFQKDASINSLSFMKSVFNDSRIITLGDLSAIYTTASPTAAPTSKPTSAPTAAPTSAPTAAPTSAPTSKPTSSPTETPTSQKATETDSPTASSSSAATETRAVLTVSGKVNETTAVTQLSSALDIEEARIRINSLNTTTKRDDVTVIDFTITDPPGANITSSVLLSKLKEIIANSPELLSFTPLSLDVVSVSNEQTAPSLLASQGITSSVGKVSFTILCSLISLMLAV